MIILYEQTDKSVAIVNFPDHVNIKHVIRSHIPKDSPYMIVEMADLPNENDISEFSDALRANFNNNNNKNIHFDISVAREITKTRLRKERISLFEANDIKLRDAMIEGDNSKLILATQERDRLRNITLLTDQAHTLDDLRSLHP